MKKEATVDAICSLLERKGVITEKISHDLKLSFKNRSQVAFDDFLLTEGLVSKEDLLNALSAYYEVPSFDPVGFFFDHYILIHFPKDFLLRNLIVPLEIIDDNIMVVIAHNPNNEELLPELGKYVSYDIQFMVSIASGIVKTINEFYDKSPTDIEIDDNIRLQEDHEKEADIRHDLEEDIED